MKRFLFVLLVTAVMALLVWGVFFFFSPAPYRPAPGPKVQYHVLEGAIEVFSLRQDRVAAFLGIVKPGETLMAPSVAIAPPKVPLALKWVRPAMEEALRRFRYALVKEGEKSKTRDFTVSYTHDEIKRNFLRQFEQSRFLANSTIDLEPGGFSLYARIGGVSMSGKGTLKTLEAEEDKLFLSLEWLKLGSLEMPPELLRSVESLFDSAYSQSGNFPVKVTRIVFGAEDVTFSLRKTGEGDFEEASRDLLTQEKTELLPQQ